MFPREEHVSQQVEHDPEQESPERLKQRSGHDPPTVRWTHQEPQFSLREQAFVVEEQERHDAGCEICDGMDNDGLARDLPKSRLVVIHIDVLSGLVFFLTDVFGPLTTLTT